MIILIYNRFWNSVPEIILSLKKDDFYKETEINVPKNVDYDFYDFEGFNNSDEKANFTRIIVPNIVHIVYLQFTEIKFYQMVNIFSIFLNHKPDKLYIHCDDCSFHGKYWDQIQSVRELVKIIVLKKVDKHDTVFGVKTIINHRYITIFIRHF